jgi:hypothetical protein
VLHLVHLTQDKQDIFSSGLIFDAAIRRRRGHKKPTKKSQKFYVSNTMMSLTQNKFIFSRRLFC